MKYLDLENRERYGSLDRAGWSRTSDDYVALKKARKIRFQRFGVFASVALWLAILAAVAGFAAAFFAGLVAVFAGFVPAAPCFAVSRHFVVAAERDYYEAALADKRAREINKWLNEQGSASASEP